MQVFEMLQYDGKQLVDKSNVGNSKKNVGNRSFWTNWADNYPRIYLIILSKNIFEMLPIDGASIVGQTLQLNF